MNAINRKPLIIFFVCFYAMFCFLSLNRHSKATVFDYHSEIFSDKSGYYVYLPALFIYDFKADKLPPQIAVKTGKGFSIDSSKNKIFTKYTYGVALMQSPFFLVAHLLAKPLGYENNGFSLIYDRMIDFAGVFYAGLGFIFLFLFLTRYVSKKIAIITLTALFLGTNLFYYSIFETGMSHVYSFFLFSVFLYLSEGMFKPGTPFITNLVFGIIVGLIIIVRPINVIFFPVFFMFNKPGLGNIKGLLKPCIIIAFSACILVIPQLMYWRYLSGHLVMYSYTNEGFTNVLSPKILSVWFSTNNGLFLYSPLVLIMLSGLIYMRKFHNGWSLFLAFYFLFISYVISSWWCWNYGGSYGSRPFVEYYALLSLPFCYLMKYIMESKVRLYVLGFLIVLCITWNLKLIFSFDGYWYGGDWDWQAFGKFIVSPTK
ncbi:MAG TPA: hypothetical protein VK808_05075 [Bacteroidia bacterium]|jgi:hypothetical protein|nr:hypothetical protein [Bacteroidia bacterium]